MNASHRLVDKLQFEAVHETQRAGGSNEQPAVQDNINMTNINNVIVYVFNVQYVLPPGHKTNLLALPPTFENTAHFR